MFFLRGSMTQGSEMQGEIQKGPITPSFMVTMPDFHNVIINTYHVQGFKSILSIGGGNDLAKLTIFQYWGDDSAKLIIIQ